MSALKTLFLVRHGKADEPWDYDSDFERPLTRKGKMAVIRLGEALFNAQRIPELVVSSPAFRTAQTARLLCETLGLNPNAIAYEAALYPGTPALYEQVMRQRLNTTPSLMLVGHNPNLEHWAALLSKQAMPVMPTAGCAVFSWNDGLDFQETPLLQFAYSK